MTKRAATKMVETSDVEKAFRIEKALQRANSIFVNEKSAKLWLAPGTTSTGIGDGWLLTGRRRCCWCRQ